MDNGSKTRIDWIDIAREYGILLVIFAHYGIGRFGYWIYSFHIPLFFVLSGYVFNSRGDFKSFLLRKIKGLLIPYVALSIPISLFTAYSPVGVDNRQPFGQCVLKFVIQNRHTTLWFMTCLFLTNIIFFFLTKIDNKIIMTVIVLGMAIVGVVYYKMGRGSLPWNVDVCFTSAPFFLGGYLFKLNYGKIKDIITLNKSIILFFVLGIINVLCLILSVLISKDCLEMFQCRYGFAPLTYVGAFAGSFCVIIFSHWFNAGWVKYIGENSMLYFAWHQAIFIPLINEGLAKIGISYDMVSTELGVWVIRMFKYILVILALTLINVLISKTKLRVLLGKVN